MRAEQCRDQVEVGYSHQAPVNAADNHQDHRDPVDRMHRMSPIRGVGINVASCHYSSPQTLIEALARETFDRDARQDRRRKKCSNAIGASAWSQSFIQGTAETPNINAVAKFTH